MLQIRLYSVCTHCATLKPRAQEPTNFLPAAFMVWNGPDGFTTMTKYIRNSHRCCVECAARLRATHAQLLIAKTPCSNSRAVCAKHVKFIHLKPTSWASSLRNTTHVFKVDVTSVESTCMTCTLPDVMTPEGFEGRSRSQSRRINLWLSSHNKPLIPESNHYSPVSRSNTAAAALTSVLI